MKRKRGSIGFYFFVIEGIIFLLTIVLGVAIMGLKNDVSAENFIKWGLHSIRILSILAIAILFIFSVSMVISFIKDMRKNSGDYFRKTFFREIDECKRGGNENHIQYILCVKKIDKVYGSVEMRRYVQEQRLDKLFERKSFLEKNVEFNMNSMVILKSIILALACNFLWEIVGDKGILNGDIDIVERMCEIFIVCVLIALFFYLPCIEKGYGGSYMYQIDNYEMEKLNLCIEKAIHKSLDSEMKIRLVACETKRRLCEALYRKHKRKLNMEVIKLELLPEMLSTDCKIIKAKLNGMPIGFILNRENIPAEKKKTGCENQMINSEKEFEEYLISAEYRRCYEIIKAEFNDEFELEDYCEIFSREY